MSKNNQTSLTHIITNVSNNNREINIFINGYGTFYFGHILFTLQEHAGGKTHVLPVTCFYIFLLFTCNWSY